MHKLYCLIFSYILHIYITEVRTVHQMEINTIQRPAVMLLLSLQLWPSTAKCWSENNMTLVKVSLVFKLFMLCFIYASTVVYVCICICLQRAFREGIETAAHVLRCCRSSQLHGAAEFIRKVQKKHSGSKSTEWAAQTVFFWLTSALCASSLSSWCSNNKRNQQTGLAC